MESMSKLKFLPDTLLFGNSLYLLYKDLLVSIGSNCNCLALSGDYFDTEATLFVHISCC